jgi:hypothetical protein
LEKLLEASLVKLSKQAVKENKYVAKYHPYYEKASELAT